MNDRINQLPPLPGTVIEGQDGRLVCMFTGNLNEPFICPNCTGVHVSIGGDGWMAMATLSPQLAADLAAQITKLLPTSRLPS